MGGVGRLLINRMCYIYTYSPPFYLDSRHTLFSLLRFNSDFNHFCGSNPYIHLGIDNTLVFVTKLTSSGFVNTAAD